MFTPARMWNVSAQRHQQHYIVLFRATGVWGEKWYKIDSKMKAHRLFVCSIYLMCKPALIKNHWLIRYFVFLQDQVGSLYLERK